MLMDVSNGVITELTTLFLYMIFSRCQRQFYTCIYYNITSSSRWEGFAGRRTTTTKKKADNKSENIIILYKSPPAWKTAIFSFMTFMYHFYLDHVHSTGNCYWIISSPPPQIPTWNPVETLFDFCCLGDHVPYIDRYRSLLHLWNVKTPPEKYY